MTLMQQLFEQVLEPVFPYKFQYNPKSGGTRDYNIELMMFEGGIFAFDTNIEHSFWLAEKVGLFGRELNLSRGYYSVGWMIWGTKGECFVGNTIPEVICKAVLEIYGKKGVKNG